MGSTTIVYVGNLHLNASEAELHSMFNHYGEVLSVVVFRGSTGRSKAFGHVRMKKTTNCRAAIKQLNGINYMNQFLEVYAITPDPNVGKPTF